MNFNVGLACRICLREDENNKLINALYYKTTNYSDLLQEFAGIDKIKDGNTYPERICSGCTKELIITVKFISKCRITNEELERESRIQKQNSLPGNFIKKEVIEIKYEKDPYDDVAAETTKDNDDDAEEKDDVKEEKDDIKKIEAKKKTEVSDKLDKKKLKYECETCGMKVPNNSTLTIHQRVHTGERPFRCAYCECSYTQMSTLTQHIKCKHINSSKPSFICDVCGKKCSRRSDLVAHLRVHSKEKPFLCSLCSRGFSQAGSLKMHIRVHTKEKPYLCKSCGKKFSNTSTLRKHQIVHAYVRKEYPCPMCEKIFKSKLGQTKHITNAHVMEYVCDKCGKFFKNASFLHAHMRAKHSKTAGFCETCQKQFSDLPKHVKLHSGITPFHCALCPKKFTHQSALTRHSKHHIDEFVCDVGDCRKTFSMQCKLDFHILKFHSTETPYACQYCSKKLYRAVDLTIHLKRCLELKK